MAETTWTEARCRMVLELVGQSTAADITPDELDALLGALDFLLDHPAPPTTKAEVLSAILASQAAARAEGEAMCEADPEHPEFHDGYRAIAQRRVTELTRAWCAYDSYGLMEVEGG